VPSPRDKTPSEGLDELIRWARLEAIQRENRRKAEEEAARAGRYVLAETTSAAMARLAGDMMTVFEGALVELADGQAAEFKNPRRDVLYRLKKDFRAVRERLAASARARLPEIPASVLDEPPEATGEA